MRNEAIDLLDSLADLPNSQHRIMMHLLIEHFLNKFCSRDDIEVMKEVFNRNLDIKNIEMQRNLGGISDAIFSIFRLNLRVNHEKNPDIEEFKDELPFLFLERMKGTIKDEKKVYEEIVEFFKSKKIEKLPPVYS